MASGKPTQIMHNDYNYVFTGIGCFKCTFLLQIEDNVKPYQVPALCEIYVLKKLFRKELERLQEQQILTPLVVDETAE